MNEDDLRAAVRVVSTGGVLAYPTESIFGLGCDPWHEEAVARILRLKGRAREMGLIVIVADAPQLEAVSTLPADQAVRLAQTRVDRPTSWIVPAASDLPSWVSGGRDTVAVRFIAHPFAKALCQRVGHAVVSTSANPSGQPPAATAAQVRAMFSTGIDLVVDSPTGGIGAPSTIRDWTSGDVLRN
ncbi:MAG: L-threonylcarbamoyladenylate synthase [Pseudomonadota bacterium]